MKRRLSVLVAGVLAASMTFGMTVCAAPSPTTHNTNVISGNSTETATTATTTTTTSTQTEEANTPVSTIIISRDANGTATSTVGSVKVSANYSQVSVPNAVGTAVSAPVKEAATTVLTDYVKAQLATTPGTIVGTFKLRLYKAGVAITDNFGTMPVSFGVGNKYDGKTATVYQIHKDGTITATVVTVAKGKVSLPVTEMGSFTVVINK